MSTIRLIREVPTPTGRGPGNGQYALQRALRAARPDWLRIGGELEPGEIPWVWSWEDAAILVQAAVRGEPFIAGPNVLFADSRRPRREVRELAVCEAASCRLLFTESDWYAALIRGQLGPRNLAPVRVWNYPIDPVPEGPLPIQLDGPLVYAKSGFDGQLLAAIRKTWPKAIFLRYGRYERPTLLDLARRAAGVLYLSDDDRGPLALAEILLCGCPAIGVARGAPWILESHNGVLVDRLEIGQLRAAFDRVRSLDRDSIRQSALIRFSPARIAGQVIAALGAARD